MVTPVNVKRARFEKPQTISYCSPNIPAYEEQTGLVVAPGDSCVSLEDETSVVSIFNDRICAALNGQNTLAPAIYPGVHIPMPGQVSTFAHRGNFFGEHFEFFQKHGWFPDHGCTVEYHDVPLSEPWVWSEVEQPNLQYVFQSDVQSAQPKNEVVCARAGDSSTVESVLQSVHVLWHKEPMKYSRKAIQLAREWIGQMATASLSESPSLALFEIEAAASFITYTAHLQLLAHIQLAGNWIAVFKKQLGSIRQTELCLNARIFDELLNLRNGRFAPIIINEYDTISDGNHRFTASWIWNVLRYCVDDDWKLGSSAFQTAVRRSLGQAGLSNSPVTLHQVLYHLGFLLSHEALAGQLEQSLRPALRNGAFIENIPVVFVPEYLCCAVSKSEFDSGTAVVRAHPNLYRTLVNAPHTVLSPRLPYHYTDCILLPWFQVVN
jgi:hypothetical protein